MYCGLYACCGDVVSVSRDWPCGKRGWSRGPLPLTPGFRQRAEPIFSVALNSPSLGVVFI